MASILTAIRSTELARPLPGLQSRGLSDTVSRSVELFNSIAGGFKNF